MCKWPDGKTYYGNWKQGTMDGHGEIRWPDGRHYEGDWNNGKI